MVVNIFITYYFLKGCSNVSEVMDQTVASGFALALLLSLSYGFLSSSAHSFESRVDAPLP